MKIECLKNREMDIAVVSSDEKVIVDVQSALDLMMTVQYETSASRIVLDKNLVCEDFFILSTGVAGEILQKFINYRVKAAIYGDYSRYTSKPLRDFIYESNNGHDFFFVSTKEEAVQKLNLYKPMSIGQASRISGVSPADISVLLVHLEQLRHKGL